MTASPRLRSSILRACGLLAFALAVRVAWVEVARVDPNAKFNFDMTWYQAMGERLARGEGFTAGDGPTAAWPPGYPALLALLHWAFGGDFQIAQLANAAIGALTCLVTFGIGRRLFDDRVALLGGALLAVYPGHVMFSALLMSEILFTALLASSCWLFALWSNREGSRSPGRWTLWGALAGFATLVRGTTLAFPAVAIGIWWIRDRNPRSWAPSAGAVALGFALVVGPWLIRNTIQMGEFVLVSNNLGRTLVLAHLPRGAERRYQSLEPMLGEVGLDRRMRRDALAHVARHPLQAVARVPGELWKLYAADDAAFAWGRIPDLAGRRPVPILDGLSDPVVRTMANTLHWTILLLAGLGLPAALDRRHPERWIVPGTILYVTLLHGVVFQGAPRFHIPLAPLISVLAAVGLCNVRQRASIWSRARLGGGSEHTGGQHAEQSSVLVRRSRLAANDDHAAPLVEHLDLVAVDVQEGIDRHPGKLVARQLPFEAP